MTDRVPVQVASNGAIRYGIYDVNGNLIRYEYIKNEDGATTTGTPLNKANLLTDTTATKLGLSASATVNDAIDAVYGKVGDTKSTKRTDLGADWLLCNGLNYDISQYPILSTITGGSASWVSKSVASVTTSYGNCSNIKYLNGYYVFNYTASSGLCYICYTTDLINGSWTTYQISASGFSGDSMIYANGYYVIASTSFTNLNIYYSSTINGTYTAKTIATSGSNYNSAKIIYDGTNYIVTTLSQADNKIKIYYCSTVNGTWTLFNVNQAGTVVSVMDFKKINSDYVILTYANAYGSSYIYTATSITGTWTQTQISTTMVVGGNLSIANGYYVVGGFISGAYPAFAYSSSLTSGWTTKTLQTGVNYQMSITSCVYFNGEYIIAGNTSGSGQRWYKSATLGGTWNAIGIPNNSSYFMSHFMIHNINSVDYLTYASDYTGSGGAPYINVSSLLNGSFKALPTVSLNGLYTYIKVQ